MRHGYQETFPFSEPNTPLASGDDIKQQSNLQAGKPLPRRCKINLAKTQQAAVTWEDWRAVWGGLLASDCCSTAPWSWNGSDNFSVLYTTRKKGLGPQELTYTFQTTQEYFRLSRSFISFGISCHHCVVLYQLIWVACNVHPFHIIAWGMKCWKNIADFNINGWFITLLVILAVPLLNQDNNTKFINDHRSSQSFKSLEIKDKVINMGLVFSNWRKRNILNQNSTACNCAACYQKKNHLTASYRDIYIDNVDFIWLLLDYLIVRAVQIFTFS